MSIVEHAKSKTYLFKQAWQGLKKERSRYVKLITAILAGYLMTFVKRRSFRFKGKEYAYFYHPYNHTWVNERAIEIPLVKQSVDVAKRDVLEIGNVLKHYFPLKHDVVDKYEKGEGILNEDVVDFKTKKKYSLIVSISTMEHVGWDEAKRDAEKIPRSIEHLKKHLKQGGRIVMTVPLDYNSFLDTLIARKALCNEMYFFRRGLFGSWRHISYEEAQGARYIYSVSARVLAMLVIRKNEKFL